MKAEFLGLSVTALMIAAAPAGAETFTASKILFQDVTGKVEITTTAAEEIEVVIRQGKSHKAVELSMKDGLVTVKGERWKDDDHHDCCNDRIRREVHLRHDRTLSTGAPVDDAFFADYPTIVVSMPRKGAATFVDARMKLAMDDLDGPLDLEIGRASCRERV